MNIVNPDAWLQLGVAGAALLILFLFVYMFMNNSNKNINNLCDKIDRLVETVSLTNTDIVRTLTHTVTKVREDQDNNKVYLVSIEDTVNDIKSDVGALNTKIDLMMKLRCKFEVDIADRT